jgi:Domain of unknown function (DUF397)
MWRTSRRSSAQGNCVELDIGPNKVLVRDSKNKTGDGKVLEFSLREWENILDSIHEGTFNWFHFRPLMFTPEEKKAFVLGVIDHEFDLPNSVMPLHDRSPGDAILQTWDGGGGT